MAECGILDLGSCLPQKFMEYVLSIINAPLQPFLYMVKSLLSEPIRIDLLIGIWAIIVYMLSMFYAFLIIYSGFSFITSGYDVSKRENAKSWLKNVIIMIILVQCSFFLYQLVLDLSSVMTASSLTLIDNNFFLLTVDSLPSIGLEFILAPIYLVTLLSTVIILTIRYAVVAIGAVLFPLGIFFYFIEPLRSYGLLILNFLGTAIFVTFLDVIILIGFSQLVSLPIFSEMKMLVMVSSFLTLNLVTIFLLFFSMLKSAFNVGMKVASIVTKVGAML